MIGSATLTPVEPLVAGSTHDLTVRYAAGRYGVDDGGALKLSWRFASDMAEPKVTAETDAAAQLQVRYEARGNVRPWMKTILVRVVDGFLAEGQTITIRMPATRIQTFVERPFRFRLFVDPFGAAVYEEVPNELGFEVVPGRTTAVVTTVGHGWRHRRGEDAWGNPTIYSRVIAPAEPRRAGELLPFWGDLHGQSGETIGTGTVGEYFAYARDVAALDFCAHQGNDFQVTPAIWDEIRLQTRRFHEPGRFVTLLGVEWSAITAAGGDHNVLYPGDDGPIHRSSHWQVADRCDGATDAYPVEELHKAFKGQDVLLIPHIGGRRADITRHDPALERLIEIHSCWGTFEWLLDEAMERGYRVGFTAGSDDHKGRPGAAAPGAGSFAVRGGLTCVWAAELTRAALWEALRARRTSCTTGPRILASMKCGDHWMGEEIAVDGAPTFELSVVGTDALEEVQIRRATEVVYRWAPPYEPGNRVRVAWSGARILDRNRQQTWDGSISVRGTEILDAQPYAFDSPDEGIVSWASTSVTWRSRTAGDEDGVVLTLSKPRQGTLTFESAVTSFTVDLASLGRTHIAEAGGIRRQLEVRRLSEAAAPDRLDLRWTAPEVAGGAYFVRVKQADGALAWTSPLFVDARGVPPKAKEGARGRERTSHGGAAGHGE